MSTDIEIRGTGVIWAQKNLRPENQGKVELARSVLDRRLLMQV